MKRSTEGAVCYAELDQLKLSSKEILNCELEVLC